MAQHHHQLDMKDPTNQDEHHAHHPHPKVSVRDQDTITWFMDEDFLVINIEQTDDDPKRPKDVSKPPNPFYRPLPFDARGGTDGKFRVNSGPAVSAAAGQHYKASFQIKSTGEIIDPDFVVD
jgi:hypothetical protein